MERRVGLRKGLWTEEEDSLLRKCVEKHGEGKWHEIAVKAGLNRCRKSCTMRWLNYLKPNINRGQFIIDEVDLILRLHKLLGNRWSLIAGRLPGRTANDVKNYWNTHIRKKMSSECKKKIENNNLINPNDKAQEITKTSIFKPQPRTLSKNIIRQLNSNVPDNSTTVARPSDNEDGWWRGFLLDDDKQSGGIGSSRGSVEEEIVKISPSRDNSRIGKNVDENLTEGNLESSYLNPDLFIDLDVWDFLHNDAYYANISSLI